MLVGSFTPSERARIQAASHCDAKTVRAYPNVREASRLRIEQAARELGIAIDTTKVDTAVAELTAR